MNSRNSNLNIKMIVILLMTSLLFTAVALLFTFINKIALNSIKVYWYFAVFVFFFLLNGIMFLYLYKYRNETGQYNVRTGLLLNFMLLINTLISMFLEHYVSIYIVPLVLGTLYIAVLVDDKTAMMFNIVSILIFYAIVDFSSGSGMLSPEYPIVIFSNFLCGSFVIYGIKQNARRIVLVALGFLLGAIVCSVTMLYNLIMDYNVEYLNILIFSFVSGVFSVAVFMTSLPIVESLFNLSTNFRLVELVNPDIPLLKELKERAPGTYYHSVQIANLAVSCAIAIGENQHLAKACAMYHDIGKLYYPEYFTENQIGIPNPHDDLTPEVSVKIITDHVDKGLDYAKKYHLPEEITEAIYQHHGTLPVIYFYRKAQSFTEGEVDKSMFSYHNETPKNKINAILMIADACEAAIRAIKSPSIETVTKVVNDIVDERLKLGQFDDCPITLKELYIIKTTIITSVPAVMHERVSYQDALRRN